MKPLIERFEAKFKKTSGCWIWAANKNNKGYGLIRPGGLAPKQLAHRVSYSLYIGEIPDNTEVMHVCDTPLCVNPEHLKLGTHAENMSDMWSKNRARPGRVVGSQQGGSKLTEDDVREIRRARMRGTSCKALAKEFNISFSTVSDVCTRSWLHVADPPALIPKHSV